MALTASEIRKKIRRQAEEERRARENAVVEVAAAATAANRARAENDARLRSAFDSALRLPHGDARAAELRAAFDAALTDAAEVRDAELTVGRAVLSATRERKVTQAKLAEFTGLRVEDLRAWAELAAPTDTSERAASAGKRRSGAQRGDTADGFAVVVSADDETGFSDRDLTSGELGVDDLTTDE
ncbi:hypothetical protein [Amycolatopsis thailandensis]|uniref:hypothetical protein n=1 Tax=Amycolatopsis thailandensis TaxID=589330 RepID=UPI001178BCF2|nr:hypothetical protein [Amycolatopsis thailandensis]